MAMMFPTIWIIYSIKSKTPVTIRNYITIILCAIPKKNKKEKPSAYKTDTVLYCHIDYKMQPDFEMLKMRREESTS